MNCCINCFIDEEIINIIKCDKTIGKCDFCGKENVNVCNIEKKELRENFQQILEVYQFSPSVTDSEKKEKSLFEILANEWDIFKLDYVKIKDFLINLFPDKDKSYFERPVNLQHYTKEHYSILGNYEWEDFVKEIKEKNRFHTKIINTDLLSGIFKRISKDYGQGKYFYRGRLCSNKDFYAVEEMGAPPISKAGAGRANSQGIRCLYLADSPETTTFEVRAGLYDDICIGTFKARKPIRVVNLALLDKISPFRDIDIASLAINLPHLKKIAEEISRPLKRGDSPLDYLPTQYISDFIKSLGFDGIEYESTMRKNGINLAVFDPDIFECIRVEKYEIESIEYKAALLSEKPKENRVQSSHSKNLKKILEKTLDETLEKDLTI